MCVTVVVSPGYSCANVYTDTLDLGNTESGRDVYPCVKLQGEVSEYISSTFHTACH